MSQARVSGLYLLPQWLAVYCVQAMTFLADYTHFFCYRCRAEVYRWKGDQLLEDPVLANLCRLDVDKERAKQVGLRFMGTPPRRRRYDDSRFEGSY
jgi:hypothetical protein